MDESKEAKVFMERNASLFVPFINWSISSIVAGTNKKSQGTLSTQNFQRVKSKERERERERKKETKETK